MRYSYIQITGTLYQPYFHVSATSNSVVEYIKREFDFVGALDGGIEMYLEKKFSRAALVPETHPLFNCDVIYSVSKSSDFSTEGVGTTEQYSNMNRMIESVYIYKLVDLVETDRSKNKKP
jgi:hypothetical protein